MIGHRYIIERTYVPKMIVYNAFSINGIGERVKIPMIYIHGEMYQYQLIQTTKKQDAYTYGEIKYKITVYVKNSENGGMVTELMSENGSGKKCADITFRNQYEKKGSVDQQITEPVNPVMR